MSIMGTTVMKLFILSTFLALAAARIVDKEISRCDGIIVGGINHEKEILKENIDKPYMMSVDYDTNVLYYTNIGNSGKTFIPVALNLKTKDDNVIPGVSGAFATSVDPNSHKIYIGGDNGIYEFDYRSNTTRNLGITNLNIWQVFAKDGIYFTSYPGENAFVYKNGKLNEVAGIGKTKAMLLGLDNENNLFFSNSSGFYLYAKDGDLTVHVRDHTVNSFTTDSNGKLYFSTPVGIFSIDEVLNNQVKITKLAGIINIYGMAVESDGTFIYATDNSIIRLKSTGVHCSEEY